MEDEETLQARAIVGNSANFIHDLINEFFANSVVTPSIVVRSIFFAGDHQFRVEQAAVRASPDLVNHVGLEITVDSSRHIFALSYVIFSSYTMTNMWNKSTRLREEGAESMSVVSGFPLFRKITVRLFGVC